MLENMNQLRSLTDAPPMSEPIYDSQHLTNSCAVNAAAYVAEQFGVSSRFISTEEAFIKNVIKHREFDISDGTAPENVGKVLERIGIAGERHFDVDTDAIADALEQGRQVIVGVDPSEYTHTDPFHRKISEWIDETIGERPGHAVVVTAVDKAHDTVTIYDPDNGGLKCLSREVFDDAHEDSNNFAFITKEAPERDFGFPKTLEEAAGIAEIPREIMESMPSPVFHPTEGGFAVDFDVDGKIDFFSGDDNMNYIPDILESNGLMYRPVEGGFLVDTNIDGIFDKFVPDADHNGIPDSME